MIGKITYIGDVKKLMADAKTRVRLLVETAICHPVIEKKNAKQVVEGLPTLSFPVRGPHSRTCLP